MKISAADSKWLLQFARRAILSRWSRETMVEALGDRVLATDLHAPGACFVTLEEMGELRGCIGSLIAHRPLYEDVWENAQAAAFDDPRFTPVKAAELELVSISISILTPPQPFPVQSEEDLLQQIRPGIDGLILSSGHHKATFLPAVWEDLPNPREFLRHLKVKAGLKPHDWPANIEFERYQSLSLKES